MSSVQLSFTLRTTPTVRSLHLVGSWDNYKTQLPMSLDPSKKKSSGAWAGTFKFQPGSLQAGARYWYYYIMDGYHVTHDPARDAVVEPTTQRKLNVLDIPAAASSRKTTSTSTSTSSKRRSAHIAVGRGLSPSRIACPRPYRPGQTSTIANETYSKATLSEIEARLARVGIDSSESEGEDDEEDDDSDDDSDVPSLSSSRSGASSPSSLSSASSVSSCSCERYGITRAGNRVKLDCGGSRCGYSDSDCSSDDDAAVRMVKSTRQNGVLVRS